MFLSKILLNHRCKEVRRDLSDPYQMHSTLCRAFSSPEVKCPPGTFLWRLEQTNQLKSTALVLLQSQIIPVWENIGISDWLDKAEAPLNLEDCLKIESIKADQRFRFRLRANPSVTRNSKRLGLFNLNDQENWILKKGVTHGFKLSELIPFDFLETGRKVVDVQISQPLMLRGYKHDGLNISIFSVQYDGILTVTDPVNFVKSLKMGIGHGKSMGLGLLSLAPIL